MTEQNKKTYTPEFKKEAVRLVTEQGYKVTEAARNIGIHPSVLTRWKEQLSSEGTNAFPGKGRLTPEKQPWGHPLKGHCQEKKVPRKQERTNFFLAVQGCIRTAPRFSTSIPLLKFQRLMCQHYLHCNSHPSGSRSLKGKECNETLLCRMLSRPLPP